MIELPEDRYSVYTNGFMKLVESSGLPTASVECISAAVSTYVSNLRLWNIVE